MPEVSFAGAALGDNAARAGLLTLVQRFRERGPPNKAAKSRFVHAALPRTVDSLMADADTLTPKVRWARADKPKTFTVKVQSGLSQMSMGGDDSLT